MRILTNAQKRSYQKNTCIGMDGGMDPYYPINDERNNILAEQYRSLGAQELNVIFGGRLLNINIMNMAPIKKSDELYLENRALIRGVYAILIGHDKLV